MTPQSRDRNIVRVRRFTAAIAGIALAACGLFAGLAASATQRAFSSSTTTPTTGTERHDTESDTTRRATTTAQATTTTPTTTVAPVTVTPAQSAPIASSGGS